MRRKCLLLGVLLALFAVVAGASMVRVSTEDLVDHATLVVTGTVQDIESYPPDGRGVIYSEAKVLVADTIVGATVEEYVTVRYMGGEYDGLAYAVSVEPTFRVGEDVVLFLAPKEGGVYNCPDGVQSKQSVVDGTVLPAGVTLDEYVAEVAAAAGR
ncbi:MAG: hypothetical protein PVH29_08625 [Candidatus Zixiibacteriota bacterium]|jgi:hypothetical protein